jgi:choice-of-anchor B domain-containing protein
MRFFTLFFLLTSSILFSQNGDFNLSLVGRLEYPNEQLSNLWGYTAPDGTEYALVGTDERQSVVSLKNPANPVEVASIPGPQTIWREQKVWGQYAYVSLDAVTSGMLIMNLKYLPDSVPYKYWKPSITINGVSTVMEEVHTVSMDEKGVMTCNGTNVNNGSPLMFDVVTDPWNPRYLGHVGNVYSHDLLMRKDTIWSGDINAGYLSIWDVKDKSNPKRLAIQTTPSTFTHNAWLTDNSKYVFTTDERANAWVAAYDVSDLTDIKEVDRYRSADNEGQGVIPHNVHVLNDYLFISHYTDGLKIVDGHRPSNLIEVGSYDTYPGPNIGGFFGDWGVYPYFNSGLSIVSDINTGLWVLRPTLKRASYLEGIVTDSITNLPLDGVSLKISQRFKDQSKLDGSYAFGTGEPGTYQVVVEKFGYFPKTISVVLTSGNINIQNIKLRPTVRSGLSGTITDRNGKPIPDAKIKIQGNPNFYNAVSDAQGRFIVTGGMIPGDYSIACGKWGFVSSWQETYRKLTSDQVLNITLTEGYADDYNVDLGWTTSATATTGSWVREIPIGTTNSSSPANPNVDSPNDGGPNCFATGNAPGAAGAADIDDGVVTLLSPLMNLPLNSNPTISFDYWWYNGGGTGTPNDTFRVFLIQNGVEKTVFKTHTNTATWQTHTLRVNDFFNTNLPISIKITGEDLSPGHLAEAGFDNFKVNSILSDFSVLPTTENWVIFPNPIKAGTEIYFDALPENATLEIFDQSGKSIFSQDLGKGVQLFNIPNSLTSGMYFTKLKSKDAKIKIAKIIIQ